MLIQTRAGKALLSPGDITPETAQTLLDNGEAVQVTRLHVSHEVHHSSSEYAVHLDAGETVSVPKDVPDGLAKLLLAHESSSVTAEVRHE
jgi:hypothetical protein